MSSEGLICQHIFLLCRLRLRGGDEVLHAPSHKIISYRAFGFFRFADGRDRRRLRNGNEHRALCQRQLLADLPRVHPRRRIRRRQGYRKNLCWGTTQKFDPCCNGWWLRRRINTTGAVCVRTIARRVVGGDDDVLDELLSDGAAALRGAASGVGNKRPQDAFEVVTGVRIKSFVLTGYRGVDEVFWNFADAHPLPISSAWIDHFVKQIRCQCDHKVLSFENIRCWMRLQMLSANDLPRASRRCNSEYACANAIPAPTTTMSATLIVVSANVESVRRTLVSPRSDSSRRARRREMMKEGSGMRWLLLHHSSQNTTDNHPGSTMPNSRMPQARVIGSFDDRVIIVIVDACAGRLNMLR